LLDSVAATIRQIDAVPFRILYFENGDKFLVFLDEGFDLDGDWVMLFDRHGHRFEPMVTGNVGSLVASCDVQGKSCWERPG